MRKRTLIGTLITCLALLACGGEAPKEPSAGTAGKAVDVKVETARNAAAAAVYEAVGTVRSRASTTLSSQVVGTVEAIQVREGSRVKAGQELIQIDNRDIRMQVAAAEAGLVEAESALEEVERGISAARSAKEGADANNQLAVATYGRFKELLSRNSVSRQEYDEAEARYKAAEAEVRRAEEGLKAAESKREQVKARIQQAKAGLESANVTLSYTRVTSPTDGVVTAKLIDVGALAGPGVPLLMVEDTSEYRLEAMVKESELGKIAVGHPAHVQIDALGLVLDGKVVEVVPLADPMSRSFIAKVSLPAEPLLKSGLFGKALFPVGENEVLSVAAAAVIVRGQLTGVFVATAEGNARFRLIKTGKQLGDRIEVLSGLALGEKVIVEPIERVADGMKVNITQEVASIPAAELRNTISHRDDEESRRGGELS